MPDFNTRNLDSYNCKKKRKIDEIFQVSNTNSQEMHLGHHCTSVEIFQAWQKSVLDPERSTEMGKSEMLKAD